MPLKQNSLRQATPGQETFKGKLTARRSPETSRACPGMRAEVHESGREGVSGSKSAGEGPKRGAQAQHEAKTINPLIASTKLL